MPITPGEGVGGGGAGGSGGSGGGLGGILPPPVSLSALATIERVTQVSDGAGGFAEGWNQLAVDVPCRLMAVVGQNREVVEAAELQAVSRWTCYFLVGTDLMPQDRVTIDDQLFQVVDTDVGLTEAVYLTAQLVRVRGEMSWS